MIITYRVVPLPLLVLRMTVNFVVNINENQKFLKELSSTSIYENYFLKLLHSFVSSSSHPLERNVILMSRKVYEKWIDKDCYKNTTIFVITKKFVEYTALNPCKKIYHMDFEMFRRYYTKYKINVFVIGGESMYSYFKKPDNIYLSVTKNILSYTDSKIDFLTDDYKIAYYSEENESVRFFRYVYSPGFKNERNYIDIINQVLSRGVPRPDRTETGVLSVFGIQKRFNIKNCIPMITTKKVPFKSIVEELLWFCRGDTDSKILSSRGVKIWDKNTSKEFLVKRCLHYREGVLGPGYGWQLRHCGHEYDEKYADTKNLCLDFIGFDQLEYVLYLLKTDPFSRRIFISFWNPPDLGKMALVPCHVTVQFYVSVIDEVKHLSCHFTMRSSDVFLGLPFNVTSYAVFTHIIAMKTGMVPYELVYSCGDAHIYRNHILNSKIQVKREPRPDPVLKINPKVLNKNWEEITSEDFELIGYFPHSPLKAEMAV